MHLSVNDKNIIFRPDVTSLGALSEDDVFKVELYGIQNIGGSAAVLSYVVKFFDLVKEMQRNYVSIIVKHDGIAVPGASITIDGQNFTTGTDGTATIRVENNKSYDYTVTKAGYNTEPGSISVGTDDVAKTIDIAPKWHVTDLQGLTMDTKSIMVYLVPLCKTEFEKAFRDRWTFDKFCGTIWKTDISFKM